ncbi:sensor histidine kinase N-terminal domain-containing protein, partial [Escherichia coli]|nr:sensor histidine kinase N-terminal domain-containing protein [Escherichia coli]
IEWDEGRLRVSVPPAALAVFAAPETPVRDQVTYQVSTEHGRLLAGRLDFGTRPAFDAAGLADAGTYTDTVEGQPVHVAAVVRTMYDAGRTERVVTHVAQTMNGRDAMIRQLWWPATVRQLALVGLALAMIL